MTLLLCIVRNGQRRVQQRFQPAGPVAAAAPKPDLQIANVCETFAKLFIRTRDMTLLRLKKSALTAGPDAHLPAQLRGLALLPLLLINP
tara:strand:- start:3482 stop:3748 length:267 start_codon:yes stop_codon:yes gene_type:complete